MGQRDFDTIVYIGRFQPFHNGHLATLQQAFELADTVVVGLGSAGEAPSPKNPFSDSERMDMIRGSVTPAQDARLYFALLHNVPGDDKFWANNVRREVRRHMRNGASRVALTGMKKDASSFYLDLFPEWKFVPGPPVQLLNATDVRVEYFGGAPREVWAKNVPTHVAEFLDEYKEYERYNFIRSTMENNK